MDKLEFYNEYSRIIRERHQHLTDLFNTYDKELLKTEYGGCIKQLIRVILEMDTEIKIMNLKLDVIANGKY